MKHFYFFTNRVVKSFRGLVLAALVVFGTASSYAATITITQASSGIVSGSYDSGTERTWTQTVGFGAKAVMKQSGQAALQFQASNGVIYNTGALPGNITSIAVTQTGTARACTVYGGTARLVNSTAANYTVTGGTSMGTTSGTPSTVNFSGSYTFFAIKVPSSATYITQIVITYADGPTITTSPTSLSGFTYVQGSGPSATQTFTVSGANLTANISLAAPTNYEISLSSGSGYTTSLT